MPNKQKKTLTNKLKSSTSAVLGQVAERGKNLARHAVLMTTLLGGVLGNEAQAHNTPDTTPIPQPTSEIGRSTFNTNTTVVGDAVASSKESFTQKMIEEAPFIFDGTSEEQTRLKNIYLDCLKTPEGRQNVESLKSAHRKIVLKLVPLDENVDGNVYYVNNLINLNSIITNKGSVITLRHEMEHIVDLHNLPPKNYNTVSSAFYYDKLMELKTKVNDVMMAYENKMTDADDANIFPFVEKNMRQAREMLPDTPDKEQKAREFARVELMKAFWRGGPDNTTRSNWSQYYNQQAFQNATRYGTQLATDDVLKRDVSKMLKGFGIPLDADFVINNLNTKANGEKVSLGRNSISIENEKGCEQMTVSEIGRKFFSENRETKDCHTGIINHKGKPLFEEIVRADGRKETKKFQYNDKGVCTKSLHSRFDGSQEITDYDDTGNCVKKEINSSSGKRTTTYDAKGNRIRKEIVGKNSKTICDYNQEDNLKRMEITDAYGGKEIENYDDNGYKTSEEKIFHNGKSVSVNYNYDDNGNKVKEKRHNFDGSFENIDFHENGEIKRWETIEADGSRLIESYNEKGKKIEETTSKPQQQTEATSQSTKPSVKDQLKNCETKKQPSSMLNVLKQAQTTQKPVGQEVKNMPPQIVSAVKNANAK